MTLTIQNKTGKEAWLKSYGKGSVKIYSRGFTLFIKFMNETEAGEWSDQKLLKERTEDVKNRTYAFEQKILEFYEWLKTYDSNFSDNTRKSYAKAIRSFFAHHRLDIKFTRSQKSKIGKKAKPKRAYYDFTLEDIKALANVSKPKERYILLVAKELGLRAIDFANLKQGTFTAHLNEEIPISLGKVYTIKEGVSALPFLGYDGKEAAMQWLTVLKSKGKYDPDKPMLEFGEKELSETLKRMAKRANLNTGNQRIRFHQLRVFLISRLSKVMESNRWKLIVGKEVPESAYVKPFQLKDDYRKVLPSITVNTTASIPETHEVRKLKERITMLEAEYLKMFNELEVVKDRSRKIIEWLASKLEAKIE